jgi:cytochrome b
MTAAVNVPEPEELDQVTRALHFGLAALGLLAWLTGQFAGDYKKMSHPGFTIHSWLGITLSLFVLLRLLYGLYGPDQARFASWVPYTWDRLRLVGEDLLTLAKLQLPERPAHQGLKSLVQSFGLLVFSWMALTGTLMFFYLPPGQRGGRLMHAIKEAHEIGETLIPIFLGVHLAGVLLDALFGRQKWRRTFFLE